MYAKESMEDFIEFVSSATDYFNIQTNEKKGFFYSTFSVESRKIKANRFIQCKFEHITFSSVEFNHVLFSGCCFSDCIFEDCVLDSSSFSSCSFDRTLFKGTTFVHDSSVKAKPNPVLTQAHLNFIDCAFDVKDLIDFSHLESVDYQANRFASLFLLSALPFKLKRVTDSCVLFFLPSTKTKFGYNTVVYDPLARTFTSIKLLRVIPHEIADALRDVVVDNRGSLG